LCLLQYQSPVSRQSEPHAACALGLHGSVFLDRQSDESDDLLNLRYRARSRGSSNQRCCSTSS
ncbi:hypothetical protein D049_3591, partial [Vibrio parahaemolyticus VPTS-2010]